MDVFAVGVAVDSDLDERPARFVVTVEQAHEATVELLGRLLAHAVEPHARHRVARALHDLEREGPQHHGWWADLGGLELWYEPVSGVVDDGLTAGEAALLATVLGPAGAQLPVTDR